MGKSCLYVIEFIDADTYVLHRHCGDPILELRFQAAYSGVPRASPSVVSVGVWKTQFGVVGAVAARPDAGHQEWVEWPGESNSK